MEYRKLGKSGLKVSELSFGSWVTFNTQVDTKLAEDMFKVCFDSGINFFDNAEGYDRGKSEEVMGQALKSINEPRDSYCVSSKVFFSSSPNPKPTQLGLSKKHVTEACHQAMKRLQVDYLDLYFCHRADPDTPIGETVWAMHNLITQGKVLYWGTSEWTAEEITEAYEFAEKNHLTPPTMEQPQYNLLDRKRFEVEYDPIFRRYQMGTTIWSPLASGALTGKYLDGIPEGSRATLKGYEWLKKHMIDSERGQARMDKVRNLKPIADELGVSLSKMSIAWCLLNPNVSTVILGASKVDQLKENLEALEVVPLLTEDVQRKLAGI
ncbi:MAG: NADP-dependent aryl-alcohol dehydrogenase [Gammaproteobacteria bacterium]|jgi:voltage-dependent potassium channel beta subunit|nr:aldo/keto reductase [SAR86 cluster bacterium]GIS75197.1 MAG: NADP-dependent aryl-alcohol dehydrogenase [Gammaproteobacteria bacterium]GIT32535.1 MAG: NADP-dependent aryl-alcohol dehydrogenase [Gammaproteobacteria bacterium]|tara:strand:+ start:402 stop:1370 length:969 start_codon:yes stop_codon:yes gene_type:complete